MDTTVKKFIAMMLLGAFLSAGVLTSVGCKSDDKPADKKPADTKPKDKT
jgi:membrane protein DedA with SNARE-associated domain